LSPSSRTNRTAGGVAIAAAVAAAVAVWLARTHLANRAADRLFRRPRGLVARSFYRNARPHQEAFRETLTALALGPEDRLLELGCGGGTFLEWALATGCTAQAIDHSAEMLALAAERNRSAVAAGRLTLRDADAARLPFSDEEFTAAATINAFFFFFEPAAMLAELYRTLAPAGRIAIYTTDAAPPPILQRMRIYTDDELVRMLQQAGYVQIAVRRTGPRECMQLVTAYKPGNS
jgi:ubiquinone/menaquinone biosynthesis C-methylase UbiE